MKLVIRTVMTAALLALSGPAFAGQVDEIATTDLASAATATHGEPVAQNRRTPRHASRSTSTKKTARPSSGPTHASSTPAAPAAPAKGSSHRTTVYTTPGRPGNTVVHSTPNRPGQVVVQHTGHGSTYVHGTAPGALGPPRPVHGYGYGRPLPPAVHQTVPVRTVTYNRVYPYHGVFVYGPRPVTHVTYVREAGPVQVERRDLPKRYVDRGNSFALGLKAGSLVSGTPNGDVYGDPGFGLVGQYRPAEDVALEMAVSHYGIALDPLNTRSQTQVAGSVDLFAFPWSRVSPYALAGVTWNSANMVDATYTGSGYSTVNDVSSQLGLHAGLGLELGLGKTASIDLEGRYVGWVSDSTPESPSAPGALQATAGLMIHFK
jgi:hypothetical protein